MTYTCEFARHFVRDWGTRDSVCRRPIDLELRTLHRRAPLVRSQPIPRSPLTLTRTHRTSRALCLALICLSLLLAPLVGSADDKFLTFDTLQTRPLALSPDGSKLFVANTPDSQLEIFDVAMDGTLTQAGVVQVGMEPTAVAARNNTEVWVVNFLSDSVSVVDLSGATPRVVRTLHVGDEPSDVVFAGPAGNRAFVTTAHRGQNTPYPDGEFDNPGIGRADIWVFDATDLGASLGGDEETIITVFGDKPRPLAVSNDGATVYAAIYRSGNQTMTLNGGFVCEGTSSCTLNGGPSSAKPAPFANQSPQSIDQPHTGLIVKYKRDGVSNEWQDEAGTDWSDWVKFNLPDRDVFAINANANPPVAIDGSSTCSNGSGCWAGVGTTLFNMAVNPTSGKIYVTNTDSQNHVRFEGPGTLAGQPGGKVAGEPTTVQGNLAQSRITVLDGASVTARHLNKHIDYSVRPAPAGVKDHSLATPTSMVVSSDGATLYVAAFGSGKVGVFDTGDLEDDTFTPDSNDHIVLSGGGPAGLALSGNRLYVLMRFNNSISVVDTDTKGEIQTVSLLNPEPASVVAGRPFLYDAYLTSSNGEASCSSCHISGDTDDLAWDLGNPDDDEVDITGNTMNDEPFTAIPVPGIGNVALTSCQLQFIFNNPGLTQDQIISAVLGGTADGCQFHPMKGPMTTQSLRGLGNNGPQHWRGDRQASPTDAAGAFEAFNVAFPGLVGRTAPLSGAEMDAYREFALQLRYPPNPTRNLDNSLTTIQSEGKTVFDAPDTDQVASCNDCHTLEAANGHFGGDGRGVFDAGTETFKTPHLRNMYQKVGMFGVAEPTPPTTNPLIVAALGSVTAFDPPYTNTGDQIRGFGYTHDGSVDTLSRFVSSAVFDINNSEQTRVEAFMIAFDTDLAPIVGQQVTLTSTNSGAVGARIDLMVSRCGTSFDSKVLFDLNGGAVTECDLIAKLSQGGAQRGYLYNPADDDFDPDDGGVALSDQSLRAQAATAGQELPYTAVPPGSGVRMGLDHDEDARLDGSDNCPGLPNPTQTDTDSDGIGDACDEDIDNDGIENGDDPNPIDPSMCGNADIDACDDCAQGVDGFGPLPDNSVGPDADGDGECDPGDPDDDNDGISDGADIASLNPSLCADADADGCDDCSVGVDGFGPLVDNTPSNDGLDTDGDGACNLGDGDDDNDGLLDSVETNTGTFVSASETGTNPLIGDTDGDGFWDGDEVASNTDPTDQLDPAVGVPALGPLALLMLIPAMAGLAIARLRRRR
jgi:YVTN family beta-propeller protein